MQEVRAALEQLPYNTSQVYLHTDASLMPRDRTVWASWNVIGSSGSSSDSSVCVTYWANRLQVRPQPVWCRGCIGSWTGLSELQQAALSPGTSESQQVI